MSLSLIPCWESKLSGHKEATFTHGNSQVLRSRGTFILVTAPTHLCCLH